VDYRLIDKNGVAGENTIALRGLDKVLDDQKGEKVINPIANDLFDALEDGHPTMFEIETTTLLSFNDWQEHERRDELLPHDQVATKKRFFTHTPLGERFVTFLHYKRVIRDYDRAKAIEEDTALAVASVDTRYQNNPENLLRAA
jgi:hypothetical protein